MLTKSRPILQERGHAWKELREASMALFRYLDHEKHKHSLPDSNH